MFNQSLLVFFTHRNHQYLHVDDLNFAFVCIICDLHHLVSRRSLLYSTEFEAFCRRDVGDVGDNLLCFIHYNLGYFGHLGNRIVVYSSFYMVFAH